MIDGIKINENRKKQYIEQKYWTSLTLCDYWNQSVEKYPDREYVVDDKGSRYTYRQIDEKASIIASYLIESGVKPYDVVSLQVPVWSEFVLITIACMKAGAIIHPIAMCYEEGDLIRALNQTKSKAYFAPTWFHKTDYEERILSVEKDLPYLETIVLLDNIKDKNSNKITVKEILDSYKPLEDNIEVDSNAVTLILCTSGTTSGSKGVLLTHNNIIFSESYFNKELGLTKDDIMFMPAPLNHATGFHHGIIAPMLIGAKVVLQQKFQCPQAIDIMNKEQCTYSMGSTPFIYDILRYIEEHGGSLDYLKFYLCGGAPVPGYMVQKAYKYGVKLCEVYGSTESVPHVFVRPEETLDLNGTTSGRAMEGVEVRVVDNDGKDVPVGITGEEISRGPNVFVGYLNDKDTTDKALDDEGWFYSGDLCVSDECGNIHIIGRKKDIIVRGGENLNSNEIDNDIEGCPGIIDHAVVGMPDERLGERICVYVVLKSENEQLKLPDMIEYLKSKHIPKRFWPERLEVIDKIPKTATGKVMKFVLQKDLKEKMKND